MKFMIPFVVSLGVYFASLSVGWGQVPSEPGDWPQWRGPNRDGISLEKGLLKEWPKDGPAVAWHVDNVGEGYSSLAIKSGRIYTLGDLDGVEHVIALNAADGRRVWAVQPAPVARLLEDRVEREFKQLDRNQDGTIDESEALARFGWNFNRFDSSAPGNAEERRRARATALFEKLDADHDGRLTYAEAGGLLRDRFERTDAEDKKADAAALAAQRAAAQIQAADKDGDQKVSRQ